MSLFESSPLSAPSSDLSRPLAERMRPTSLDEYIGQQHILGPGKPLRTLIERDQLSSMIFWGPPGVGKTSLARLIARHTRCDFVPFSAVTSTIKEVKQVLAEAEQNRKLGRRTLLFIDEIHRFNKSQQDAFLPYVEAGDVILIGATTENPSFEVISALLSRSRVYTLQPLDPSQIAELLQRALTDPSRGLAHLNLQIAPEQIHQIAAFSNGDARAAYALLELAAAAAPNAIISPQLLTDLLQRRSLLYDKSGDQHFDLISAFHKSIRSSDPDAALFYLSRMLEAGEDRLYIARRLVRIAVEDIGLADPRALEQTIAMKEAVHFLGIPEGDLALAQAAIYLAIAPKSDAAYKALHAATTEARHSPSDPVPLHLRNAPTSLMQSLGYKQGYLHAHDFPSGVSPMPCLPDRLANTTFYHPTNRGLEARLADRLREIRAWKAQHQNPSDPSS